MMPIAPKIRDMTPEQRKAHREFWLAWVEDALSEVLGR